MTVRHNIRAFLEAVGEADSIIAGHLETALYAPLAWDDTELTVASTESLPSPTVIAIEEELITVETLDATTLTILNRPDVLPSTATIYPTSRVVDVGRMYSDLDIARAQMLLNTATGEWLQRIAQNHGVAIPSFRGSTLFLNDERFREYLKIVCFLQAGPRYGIMRVLQAVFPPIVISGSTDAAQPTRVSFATPLLPSGLKLSLIRLNENWDELYRIQRIDPAGGWLDLWPVAGPTWSAADFETDPDVSVEILMWDTWEEPDKPGRFFIQLYEQNVFSYPWGATYLQGDEPQVSTTVGEVQTDYSINQVIGVWLASDPLREGTNYFTGGSFAGKLITLGTALPAAGTSVLVDYGAIDPSTAQLLESFLVENSPAGTYWPFYLRDYGAILTQSGIIDIIRDMGCLPTISTCVLGQAGALPITVDLEDGEVPLLASGLSFSRPSSDVVRLTPVGVEDKAFIWVHDGAGDWVRVEVPSTLDCDLTVSGSGGLDTGAQAADTGYQIFLIAKGTLGAGLRVPVLIAKLNGADIDPVLPSGYTHWSKPISFAAVDSSADVHSFVQYGDRYQYQGSTFGPIAELGYKGNTDSNTDMSNFVPYFSVSMDIHLNVEMSDTTRRSLTLKEKNGEQVWGRAFAGDPANKPDGSDAAVYVTAPHIRGTQPELDLIWDTTAIAGGGALIFVRGFQLFLE